MELRGLNPGRTDMSQSEEVVKRSGSRAASIELALSVVLPRIALDADSGLVARCDASMLRGDD